MSLSISFPYLEGYVKYVVLQELGSEDVRIRESIYEVTGII